MQKERLAQIHSFESMATLDGEGVRYAVFFCGCPLRCVYCHNPDTWFKGKEYSSTIIADKIGRCKEYFGQNGGATFSGGEPLLHSSFINEVGALLKEKGITYTLDTSGAIELTDEVKKAIINADNVILDLKFYDRESYKKYAGDCFDKVMAVGDFVDSISKKMWLRTVIIPNINDDKHSILKYYEVASRWKNVAKYELLSYHTLGVNKYNKLGLEYTLKDVKPLEKELLIELQLYLDSLR